MLTASEIDRLVNRIAVRARAEKVIVFGSYSKGTATMRSDLDLLVIKDTELPMSRRADDLRPMLALSLIAVDVLVYTPEEVEEYGKDPLSFISSALASGRLAFVAGASM